MKIQLKLRRTKQTRPFYVEKWPRYNDFKKTLPYAIAPAMFCLHLIFAYPSDVSKKRHRHERVKVPVPGRLT